MNVTSLKLRMTGNSLKRNASNKRNVKPSRPEESRKNEGMQL